MNDQLTTQNNAKLYESLALKGDLSALTPQDKTKYYASLCERLGLDPTTQPFIPLKLNNKEILYAAKGCTDQLARIHKVNRQIIKEEEIRGAYIVTVEAMTPDGRREQSKGAVPIENLKGDAFCNAIMKAETKAKRRATLSILGLGLLDETEIETIPAPEFVEPQREWPEGGVEDAVEEIETETADKGKQLDAFRSGRRMAMRIITASAALKAQGVSEDTIKSWLPEGVTSRKDLEEQFALEYVYNLNMRLRLLLLCKELTAMRVRGNEITDKLKTGYGVHLIRDLSLPQVNQVYKDFTHWLQELHAESVAESRDDDDDYVN
jgi:hypothetical protein